MTGKAGFRNAESSGPCREAATGYHVESSTFFPFGSIRIASPEITVEFPVVDRIMTTESQAIEVEVVEIDGAAPPAISRHGHEPAPEARAQRQWQDWSRWQGRVRQLDSRWWPLWVFLGVIAIVLMLTVGVVLGIVFAIFKIITGFLRALFR